MSVHPDGSNPPPQQYQGYGYPPMAPGYGYQPPMQTTSNTTVVITQPGASEQNKLLIVPVQGVREWTTGLCGCCEDMGSCLCVWCCTPCAICQIATRQGDCCCMPFCIGCDLNCTTGACNNSLLAMRARIRTLGGIRGTIYNDSCIICCCPHCALCQMDRELKAMGL